MDGFSFNQFFWNAFLIAVSAFYMLGSFALVRAMTTDKMIDDAIAKIDLEPTEDLFQEREVLERNFLTCMAVAMFSGGAFLVVHSSLAPLIFCLCLAMQLINLFVLNSKHINPSQDPFDRGSTINATLIYAVVTLLLLLAQRFSGLPSLPLNGSIREVVGVLLTVGFSIFTWLQFRAANAQQDDIEPELEPSIGLTTREHGGSLDLKFVVKILVQVEEFAWGIWCFSGDMWQPIDPANLGISPQLASRIIAWEDKYDQNWDLENMQETPLWDKVTERQHFNEAEVIAKALKTEFDALGHGHIAVSWSDKEMNHKDV